MNVIYLSSSWDSFLKKCKFYPKIGVKLENRNIPNKLNADPRNSKL